MREIGVDTDRPGVLIDPFFRRCMGTGRANLLLRRRLQEQIREAKDELGIEYLRFHGIFHDDMGVVSRENGTVRFHFLYIDEVYDFLIENGLKPFVELGFPPSLISTGEATVFWEKMNISLPEHGEWEALIRASMAHWIKRYGRKEVASWYFEVWNEPNHGGFFTGSMEEYFELFNVTSRAVKSFGSEFRIGGPAGAGLDPSWIKGLIEYCRLNNIGIDFISSHKYAANRGAFEGDAERTEVRIDSDVVTRDIDELKAIILSSSFPDLEIHFTEWGTSYLFSDPFHDQYLSASFILEHIKNNAGKINSLSYWTLSDIFEEGGPVTREFYNGFGLRTFSGIRKPSYHAYSWLNALRGNVLLCEDERCIATEEEGTIRILFWDFTFSEPQGASCTQYAGIIPAPPKETIRLSFYNLPEGSYCLRLYRCGYHANDPYTVWLEAGGAVELDRDLTKELLAISNGGPELTHEICWPGGRLEYPVDLRTNDVVLLELIPSLPASDPFVE